MGIESVESALFSGGSRGKRPSGMIRGGVDQAM